MFGKVNFSKNNHVQGFLIPTSAIIGNNDKTQVYVVKNGKAVLQSIVTSNNIGNKTIVTSGLIENDSVVINGFINLFDGANVTVK
jgi:multidrug efflux pump subunit AcrA (membrane-fusion protein)